MRDSGRLLRAVYAAMVAAGIDAPAVFQRLGLKVEMLEDAELRTRHEAQIVFWAAVEAVTGDPDVSLHLLPHMPMEGGGVIEYLALSSANMREGMARAQRYLRLVSDALRIEIEERGGEAQALVNAAVGSHPLLRHTEVCTVYGLMQFFDKISGRRFKARRVDLRMPAPRNPRDYDKAFGCPVRFGREQAAVVFDARLLDLPSLHAEPDLLNLHEQLAQKRLSALARQDLIDQVRRIFSQSLESGACSLEATAERLNLAPRRLRFELARAGTSFNQVLAQVRYDLARDLLTRTSEPVERIAYLTGFSELSTFHRAFRRWSGRTPAQFRREKQAPRVVPQRGAHGSRVQSSA